MRKLNIYFSFYLVDFVHLQLLLFDSHATKIHRFSNTAANMYNFALELTLAVVFATFSTHSEHVFLPTELVFIGQLVQIHAQSGQRKRNATDPSEHNRYAVSEVSPTTSNLTRLVCRYNQLLDK